MIVVKVELHSAVNRRKSELARMVIHNTGTSADGKRANYDALVIRKTDDFDAHMIKTLKRQARATREGQVDNYARLARPVWDLVGLALKNMGYGR